MQLVLALLLVLLAAAQALAQEALPGLAKPKAETSAEEAPGVIGDDAVPDERLARRIAGVFSRIEAFEDVTVEVHEGVVRLGGTTLSPKAAAEAAELASRFEGVIWVANRIEPETAVEPRLSPALRKLRELGDRAIGYLPLMGVALVLLGLSWIVARLVTAWEWPYERLGVTVLLRGTIRQLLRLFILLAGALVALNILDLTGLAGALVGAAGVAGLALGFAFRDIVENYLAGMLLSIRSPFGAGDFIEADGREGSVVRMTSRELILMTLDGNHVRLPNSAVFKSVIVNYTRNPRRRFAVRVGLGVDEDLRAAQAVGLAALRSMKGVMSDPPPRMLVLELGEYAVVVEFYGWVDQGEHDFLKARSEGLRLVKAALDEAGVEMPFPVQTVRNRRLHPDIDTGAPGRRPTDVPREAGSADVAREGDLDVQIREELRESREENLLTRSPRND